MNEQILYYAARALRGPKVENPRLVPHISSRAAKGTTRGFRHVELALLLCPVAHKDDTINDPAKYVVSFVLVLYIDARQILQAVLDGRAEESCKLHAVVLVLSNRVRSACGPTRSQGRIVQRSLDGHGVLRPLLACCTHDIIGRSSPLHRPTLRARPGPDKAKGEAVLGEQVRVDASYPQVSLLRSHHCQLSVLNEEHH
jgi:hypothetical protein